MKRECLAISHDSPAYQSRRRPKAGARRNFRGRTSFADEVAIVRIAQAIRQLRRVRRDEFGLAVGEPAWDMLVELYYRDSIGASTTAMQLKEASFVPGSSAHRWIKHLEQEGLVRIKAHPEDGRTGFVELTDDGREALELYLTEVRAVALQQSTGRGDLEP